MKAKQGKAEGGDEGFVSGRSHWENASVDWGRVFRGEPFSGDREKPLFYPMRAQGPYQDVPPEEIDQDTGEITTPAYWEKRCGKVGNEKNVSMWWPVEAHRRAEESRYRVFGAQDKTDARAAVEAEIDRRAGRD